MRNLGLLGSGFVKSKAGNFAVIGAILAPVFGVLIAGAIDFTAYTKGVDF